MLINLLTLIQVKVGAAEPPSDNADPTSNAVPTSEGPQGPQLVIWGTDVVVSECKERFKQYVLKYIDPNAEYDEKTNEMNEDEPLYLQKLEEVCKIPSASSILSVQEIFFFSTF